MLVKQLAIPLQCVEALLQAGSDLQSWGSSGLTPLEQGNILVRMIHSHAYEGCVRYALWFLKTSLYSAALEGKAECLSLLLKALRDNSAESKFSSLCHSPGSTHSRSVDVAVRRKRHQRRDTQDAVSCSSIFFTQC